MKYAVPLILILTSSVALAEETRQLDAHEHGVGTLNIAFDGNKVVMEFLAPGADIVGFEYAAKTAEDRASIENAVAVLARPSELFGLPADAECTVTQASAALESEEEHDDHAKHDDHSDEHEDHADHDDHDADHEDHAEDAGHTEFHAEYQLTCANPVAIDEITFAYFDTFQNARELDVQILTSKGAKSFEVERDTPILDLRNLF